MHNIYWLYEGYSGDCHGFVNRAESITTAFAPGSTSTLARSFSYLTQLGFGPGYYNSSGVMFDFRRSTFRTEAARDAALVLMKAHYGCKVFASEAEYKTAVNKKRVDQKDMRKLHPY